MTVPALDPDDPVYICGLMDGRMEALRAIIRNSSGFLGSSEFGLIKAILGIEPKLEPAPPQSGDIPPGPAIESEPL
jgi:hypothetical protein